MIEGSPLQHLADSTPDQPFDPSSIAAVKEVDPDLCPVEVAARIIGQKWTLQIVKTLLSCESQRFCELQEALGGVNPSTLSSRLKMLEDEGMIRRVQVSAIPPHVEYSLTEMGCRLKPVIQEISYWSRDWLCTAERLQAWHERETFGDN
ncbi:MAG: helix-turn-helix transcriptional regulator [Caldilineaceae bacterium]|nr:helix-turn-helix transcriptional regulator [Caldilineaceae bacterium]